MATEILRIVDDRASRESAVVATRELVQRHSSEADATAYLGLIERFARDR